MAQLTVFITLIAIGVAHAAVLSWNPYALQIPTVYGAPLAVNYLGAPVHYAGPSVLTHPLSTDSVESNPGGLLASAVDGVNSGKDGSGPQVGSALAGPTAILRGSSATLIASTGVVRGHSNSGANLGSSGSAVAPSHSGSNTPAAVQVIPRVL